MNTQRTLDLEEPPRCHRCHTEMPPGTLIGPTGGTWRCDSRFENEPRRTIHEFTCPACSEEKDGR